MNECVFMWCFLSAIIIVASIASVSVYMNNKPKKKRLNNLYDALRMLEISDVYQSAIQKGLKCPGINCKYCNACYIYKNTAKYDKELGAICDHRRIEDSINMAKYGWEGGLG